MGDSFHSPLNPEVFKYLTADIKDVYFDNKQREHAAKNKIEIRQLAEDITKNKDFQRKMTQLELQVISVTSFGSSATPLASRRSDLDLCIWLKPIGNIENTGDHENDQNLVLRELNMHLKRNTSLRKCNGWKAPVHIKKAKVPIIKAHIYGCDVDFSVHIGERQHPNTCAARLTQAYHFFNPNFIPLCFYLKEWFKYVIDNDTKGVGSAESVIPNSYTIVLLVAQFMQEKNLLPKLLTIHKDGLFRPSEKNSFPDLRGDGGITDDEISSFQTQYKTELSEELGVTFYSFLCYLTSEVNLENDVLHVESAEFLPPQQNGEKKHGLKIVDVFDKYNPGRRVKTAEGFVDFLREGRRRVENTHNPTRISDRLYDMNIDFQMLERKNRLNIKQAKTASEIKALTEQFREIVGENEQPGRARSAHNNRPGNLERKRKNLSKWNTIAAIPSEVAPDDQQIMPARTKKTM